MDQPISSTENTGGGFPSGSPSPAEQRQQGALGGRQVSEAPSQAPSLRERRGPGSVAGAPDLETPLRITRHQLPAAEADALETKLDNECGQHLPDKPEPDAAPGVTELPWLTVEQNEERRLLHGRLALWLERPEVSSERKAEVDEALGLVLRIERNLSRADELLHGMRTRLLTGDEWRELTYLVERARSNVPLFRGSGIDRLYRLVESNALSSVEMRLLEDSLQQLVDAHEFLTSDSLPWGDIVKRVGVPLGPDGMTAAAVESRVVPGTAFGSCLARGYSWDENAPPIEKALSRHVPCLALTTLTDATGQLLFRGLHQGFIGLPGLDAAAINTLSDEDLRKLVSELVLANGPNESPANHHLRVERRWRWMRLDSMHAQRGARDAQYRVGKRMAMESAAAAICADPDKYQRALGGEAVDVNLFDVALLKNEDFAPWTYQCIQHGKWRTGARLSLVLRGPDNESSRIRANCSVRQFALGVEDQGPNFSLCPDLHICAAQLLGSTDFRELGGDVLSRVGFLRSRVAQLGRELAAGGHEQVRTLPPRALDQSVGLQARNRIDSLQAEMSRLDRHARALEQAGRQLKDLWRLHHGWPTGADAYGAAARLALVAYLMGETPVLSCPTDRDYNKRLDAEVKILATVTDCRGGQVPPVDLDMATWDSARTVFRRQ